MAWKMESLDTWGKHAPFRGKSKYQGPEEGPCLEWSRNSKEASLAAVGKWGQLKEVTFCKATVRFLDFILREMGR